MSVLGTTVFKVPKLGETGFKIDQVNEQKRKQAQQQLQKEVDATGAEKAYMDNAMGLTGRYKQIADAGYQVFKDAAIEYEKTGSASAEAKMKQAASALTYEVTAGRTILEAAGKEYVTNKANGFKDVAMTPEEAGELYSGFVNATAEVIIKNGQVMVKDGDVFVPATQSTYLQSSVNMNNSLILPRTIKQGTYVNFTTFLDETKGAIRAGSSVGNAESRVNTLYEEKYKDKQFQSDVLTAYAVSEDDGLGMVEDPTKISAEKLAEIADLASNEEIVAQAKEWYRGRVLGSVAPLWSAGSTNSRNRIGAGTDYDATARKGSTIKISGINEKGEAISEEYTFDTLIPFTPNMRGKGYADPVTGDKYDIVGFGVKNGKPVAELQVGEGSTYFSFEQGRKYKTYVQEISQTDFDKLPNRTQQEVKAELAKAGYNIEDLFKGGGFDPNNYSK